MTDGAAWRFRWLLEARATIERLRASLATGVTADARLVRSMLAEVRGARRQVCALASLRADEQTLADVPEVGPEAAAAVALRLRGAPLRLVAVAAPRAGVAVAAPGAGVAAVAPGAGVAAALQRLAALLGPAVAAYTAETRVQAPPAPLPAAPSVPEGRPAEDWIGRTADLPRTLRDLRVATAAGRLPAGASVVAICVTGARGSGYLRVGFPGPASGVWGWLRRCGLRLLGPVAAGT